jgi:hypothetical protein
MEGVRSFVGYSREAYSFCLIFNGVHGEMAAVKVYAARLIQAIGE